MSALNLEKYESLMKNINKMHPLNKTSNQIATYNKAIMTFKGINNIVSNYLCSKLNLVKQRHTRNIRSAVQNNLSIPLASNSFASSTFIESPTPFCNNLPVQVETSISLLTFKKLLIKLLLTNYSYLINITQTVLRFY